MNLGWWSGKRVFVTGHTGFKGSWCCLWLQHLGAIVTGYALEPEAQPNLFESAAVAQGMTSISGDILDLDRLREALHGADAQIVLHLAAQSVVRRGYEEPVETYRCNVLGTANVIEAARTCETVRAVVAVTSDKCYRFDDPHARHKESDPLGGREPYSASKAGAELIATAFRASLFKRGGAQVPLGTARAGNVLGGGDWTRDRLVPTLIGAFEAKQPAIVRQPDAIRPWQHVLDPLAGYFELARRLSDDTACARAWNFGPPASHEQPVRQVADELAALWGENARWEIAGQPTPEFETPELRLDSSDALEHLAWAAKLDLPATLGWVVRWHKQRHAGVGARELVLADIERFEALAHA